MTQELSGPVPPNNGTPARARGGRASATWEAQEPPSDWQRYFSAVARRKWTVIAVTVAGTLLGIVAAQFVEPVYSAKAVLWLERGDARGAVGAPGTFAAEPVIEAPAWAELVRSNAVLDTVVRRLRLYLTTPEPTPARTFASFTLGSEILPGRYRVAVDRGTGDLALMSDDGTVLQRAALGDAIGEPIGVRWTPTAEAIPPRQQITFTLAAPYDAARALAAALEIGLDPGGSFLRIQLDGPDPARAAATVNAVADQAVAVAADLKRQKLEELTAILGGRYEHAHAVLQEAEAALTAFQVRTADALRARTPAVSPTLEGRDAGLGDAFELRLTLEQLRADREAVEAALSKEQRNPDTWAEGLSMLPAVREFPPLQQALEDLVQKQAELRALRYRYTEESAPVLEAKSQVAALVGQALPALARQLVQELQAREAAIEPRVDAAFGQLRRVPPLALEEARLRRNVASAEELATTVRQRYQAIRLGLLSSLPDLRILDRAVTPRRPTTTYATVLVALAFMTSLGGAVIGVTVRDRIDRKVRYPEQVTGRLGLTILGAVPRASWRLPRGGDATAEIVEALRALRVRLLHAHGVDGPLLLTVTSPGTGDGKSFLSVNLALSFAYGGYRTLLIDGDVRRGVQHRVLGHDYRPGLTDVLTEASSATEAVRRTEYANLSLLSSGTRMHRGPELLVSQGMRDLLNRLKTTYGVIIVDSPPIAAGIDPLVLATATGNLLLVLRSGTTDVSLAVSRLDVIDTLPVRLVGAVLNDVRGGDGFQDYTYDLTGYPPLDRPPDVDGPIRILGGRT